MVRGSTFKYLYLKLEETPNVASVRAPIKQYIFMKIFL